MSINKKVIIILLICVFLYVTISYGIQHFLIFPNFIDLEKEEGEKDINRCMEAIQRELHHLDVFVSSYSIWDDLANYVVNKNPDFIETNFPATTFIASDFSFAYIFDPEGAYIWGHIIDMKTEKKLALQAFPCSSLPSDHPALNISADKAVTGIIMTEKGPLISHSAPVMGYRDHFDKIPR